MSLQIDVEHSDKSWWWQWEVSGGR